MISLQQTIVRNLLKFPMSLADMQIATQVSLPTLNRAIKALSESHWIHIVGQAEANGGRPATLYGIDDRCFLIIGLHLQLPGIRLIATNLNGETQHISQEFQNIVPSPTEAIAAIGDYIQRIRAEFPSRQILGIGIAAPGFIDLTSGDIISIGRVPLWVNFPICSQLKASTGVPVQIANDIDCMAFAEFQYINAPLEKNLVYIGFDEGIKMSFFIKGELYKGSLGNAGLIASHLLPTCDPLDPEIIDDLVTIRGVNRFFEKLLTQASSRDRALYADIKEVTDLRERFRLIIKSADSGKPICDQIIHHLIRILSVWIANIIYIIQPDMIVVGGLISIMPKPLFLELENEIRSKLPALISNNCLIQQGSLVTQNSAALGASYHFLQSYLSDQVKELT